MRGLPPWIIEFLQETEVSLFELNGKINFTDRHYCSCTSLLSGFIAEGVVFLEGIRISCGCHTFEHKSILTRDSSGKLL